jgi:hypothetical protein
MKDQNDDCCRIEEDVLPVMIPANFRSVKAQKIPDNVDMTALKNYMNVLNKKLVKWHATRIPFLSMLFFNVEKGPTRSALVHILEEAGYYIDTFPDRICITLNWPGYMTIPPLMCFMSILFLASSMKAMNMHGFNFIAVEFALVCFFFTGACLLIFETKRAMI